MGSRTLPFFTGVRAAVRKAGCASLVVATVSLAACGGYGGSGSNYSGSSSTPAGKHFHSRNRNVPAREHAFRNILRRGYLDTAASGSLHGCRRSDYGVRHCASEWTGV